ncbi:MAG: cysteine synthase A [Cyclobacteriaceae bacterium]|nr:cysteine synthase A [Cyclobacteriaceae bacterium]
MILDNILNTVGLTPLVKLNKLASPGSAQVLMKIEFFHPGGSVKDRIASNMIEDAEKKGLLKKGMTIVEPTSGNTGSGLAMVAAVKGYQIIFTMPETMSVERRTILKHFGAKLILTPGDKGMVGAVIEAQNLCDNDSYYMPQQFENESNTDIHRKTTAVEIINDLENTIPDYLVVGVGTGGTITGVGKVLKEKNPDLKVIAVEPADSPFLSQDKAGPHKIQGIGAGFIPDILDLDIIDEVITVENEDAFEVSRKLCSKEGILAGISSGANVWAAMEIAKKAGEGKAVLTVLPDTGERYLSTPLFEKD